MKKQNVLMIGCGKLGLPCAEVMSRFHNIQGYDITPFSSQHVEYTNDLKNDITKNDIIFIAVPTPHDKNYGGEKPTAHLEPKDFDYSYIISVLKQILKHITLKQTVVLISTVLPGTIRNYFKPRKGSIIIDPWRKFNIKTRNYTVLYYGNTRELC
jgi:UDPglucose 6-dehydrogenase